MSLPSSTKQNRNKRTNISVLVWFFIFFMIIGLISANVFIVSIGGKHLYSSTNIKDIASNVYIKEETLVAQRGKILDRNNHVLAEDLISYKLIAFLDSSRLGIQNKPAYVVDKEATALALAPILDMEPSVIEAHLNKDLYQTELGVKGRNLTLSQKQAIQALELPGLAFETTRSRNYPLGVFASHLIGFSQYDETKLTMDGRVGLEATFNDTLLGINGWRRFQTDISGYLYKDMFYEEEPAIDGDNLLLTLDKGIQETLELSFEQTQSTFDSELVWGVVMEVETGNVLAWGHAPSFDPNAIDIENYDNVISQNIMEPGSTMKTFVYATAIDQGKYNGQATYPSGVFHMGIANGLPINAQSYSDAFTSIYNAGRKDYGDVTLDRAYFISLNTGIGHMLTSMINVKEYESYLDRFNFFKPVNMVGVKENVGQKSFKYPIEMITSGYGQGSTVTTISMMQAYSAVFNDGIMIKPKVVNAVVDGMSEEVISEYPTEIVGQPISASTSKELQRLMQVTAKEGSARFYNIPEVSILAKTGTADVVGPNGYYNDRNLYSVMMALPADDPKVMVYYAHISPTSNQPHLQTDAQQSLLRKIAMSYNMISEKDNETPEDQEESIPTKIVEIPNFVNKNVSEFRSFVTTHNITPIIWGDGNKIINTSFVGLSKVLNSTKLIVITSAPQSTMIDLTGFSKKEVQTLASLTGLNIVIEGEGWVTSQSVEANQPIESQEIRVICSVNP